MTIEGTMTGQILRKSLREGELEPGNEIRIAIDQTLTQDATGTLAFLEFMALNLPRVKTEVSVSYVDHNTLQTGFENADDHLFLRDCAKRFGVYFSKPGNGICHQVHLERFGRPFKTLLGSDSHTPTAGGLGMLAVGAGGMDVALAMAGVPFPMKVPEVINVRLYGRLPDWVSAKDVILELLRRLSVKGGLGKVFEYTGPGVKELSVYQRSCITNMGAELGAWTSLFPSDEITREFMRAHGREGEWAPLFPMEDAQYHGVIELDLSSLHPLIAMPHSPDNVVAVSELQGLKVDQVAIGSCTNSSYRDLKMVAELLKGKRIHPDVSLVISPGSRRVFLMLLEDGSIAQMVKAGARILELACGPCIGMGQAPPSGGVSIRTFNRNFKGRSGTEDAEVYLASPEVAVAAALKGRLVSPSVLGGYPKLKEPDRYPLDDSLLIPPDPSPVELNIRMGPNIRPLPHLPAVAEEIDATIVLKVGDNITTDDILPGGSKVLPLRSNIEAISKYTYHRLFPDFVEKMKRLGKGIIVAGENYGQGSSREHAALAPRYLGIVMILAKSFARLHRANLINYGIIPVQIEEEVYVQLQEGDQIRVQGMLEILRKREEFYVEVPKKGIKLPANLNLSERERDIVLAGGILNYYQRIL